MERRNEKNSTKRLEVNNGWHWAQAINCRVLVAAATCEVYVCSCGGGGGGNSSSSNMKT
jgi:hypothetical protein